MAINRIYIRCKGCGNALFLGKTFGSGYYWENYYGKGVHLEDRLNEFFDKHNYCNNPKTETTEYDERLFPLCEGFDGYDGAFDIVYEGSDGTGIIDTVDEGVKDDNLAVLFRDRINECIEEIGKLTPKIIEAIPGQVFRPCDRRSALRDRRNDYELYEKRGGTDTRILLGDQARLSKTRRMGYKTG